ncbi:MAG: sigma-54 dependent transcriptional regulator [Pirellulales bacterium]|nr:sigma-54 dependent transcriptional regulator [Pirellulales bacterium]
MNFPRHNSSKHTTGAILVVDDQDAVRESISAALMMFGHRVQSAASAKDALRHLPSDDVDVVVTDLQMPGMDGLELMHTMHQRSYNAEIVMVTAHASVSTAVEAMRRGAFDYIEKPIDVDRLDEVIRRAVAAARNRTQANAFVSPQGGGHAMIGDGTAMRDLRARIAQVGVTSETVLITGESGVGKELVARSVHANSPRHAAPFVDLNCPVLSAQLTESELFGHERGAFTGAETDRVGRFQAADGGSLLLDEITEIDLPLQAKLLRVLQEHSFQRVGSSKTTEVDVRVLATTNRNLAEEVAAGQFRRDLYFRLNVLPIHVPPLRQRREDVPALVEHFQRQSAARTSAEPVELTGDAVELLTAHDWPGNVRELQNIVTRMSVLHAGQSVGADQLRGWLLEPGTGAWQAEQPNDNVPVGVSLRDMERRLIEATLEHFDGHRRKTAEALGIGQRTLTSKLKEYKQDKHPESEAASRAA